MLRYWPVSITEEAKATLSGLPIRIGSHQVTDRLPPDAGSAQRAAELTNEYGAKFAERAQAVAADLRSQAGTDASTNGSSGNGHTAGDTAEPSPEETSGTGV